MEKLSLIEIENLSMNQIDCITPEEYSKLSKQQINSLPVLPLGLRISIALTPPEQVSSNMSKLSDLELEEYPVAFISAFTPSQIEALSPKLRDFFEKKIEKGLKVLEELYLIEESLKKNEDSS